MKATPIIFSLITMSCHNALAQGTKLARIIAREIIEYQRPRSLPPGRNVQGVSPSVVGDSRPNYSQSNTQHEAEIRSDHALKAARDYVSKYTGDGKIRILSSTKQDTRLREETKQAYLLEKFLAEQLQRWLKEVKGYRLAVDGQMGRDTWTYSTREFGFNCAGMTATQIVERLLANAMEERSRYVIVVRSDTRLLQKYDNLTPEELVTKLNEIQNKGGIKCGLDEACAGLKDPSIDMTLACQDEGGNQVKITISSQAKASITLETVDGRSVKLSAGADGKVDASLTNKATLNSR